MDKTVAGVFAAVPTPFSDNDEPDFELFMEHCNWVIDKGCDGLRPLALFVAAVLVSPVSWAWRLAGTLGGFAGLFLLNQIRIVTLYYTALLYPAYFDVMHRDVWQVLFIAVSVAIWTGWALWAQRLTSEPIRA